MQPIKPLPQPHVRVPREALGFFFFFLLGPFRACISLCQPARHSKRLNLEHPRIFNCSLPPSSSSIFMPATYAICPVRRPRRLQKAPLVFPPRELILLLRFPSESLLFVDGVSRSPRRCPLFSPFPPCPWEDLSFFTPAPSSTPSS